MKLSKLFFRNVLAVAGSQVFDRMYKDEQTLDLSADYIDRRLSGYLPEDVETGIDRWGRDLPSARSANHVSPATVIEYCFYVRQERISREESLAREAEAEAIRKRLAERTPEEVQRDEDRLQAVLDDLRGLLG